MRPHTFYVPDIQKCSKKDDQVYLDIQRRASQEECVK